jgi:hypothetical protein
MHQPDSWLEVCLNVGKCEHSIRQPVLRARQCVSVPMRKAAQEGIGDCHRDGGRERQCCPGNSTELRRRLCVVLAQQRVSRILCFT